MFRFISYFNNQIFYQEHFSLVFNKALVRIIMKRNHAFLSPETFIEQFHCLQITTGTYIISGVDNRSKTQ